MDLISIASVVASTTGSALSVIKRLHDLKEKYDDTPVIIASICAESTVISASLAHIQSLLLQRDDLASVWQSRAELPLVLDQALTGCMVIFSCLDAEIRRITSKTSVAGLIKWRARLRMLWNETHLNELLRSIRGQQSAITLLIQLLQMDTLAEISHMLRQNQQVVRASAAATQSLRSQNPSIRVANSIYEPQEGRRTSFDAAAASIYAPSELEFDFDDTVVNSQVYRRTLARAYLKIGPSGNNNSELGTTTTTPVQALYVTQTLPPPQQENDATGQCAHCEKPLGIHYIEAFANRYHVGHFWCAQPDCGFAFASRETWFNVKGKAFCDLHYALHHAKYCAGCACPIHEAYVEAKRGSKVEYWHTDCALLKQRWGIELGPIHANTLVRKSGVYLDSRCNVVTPGNLLPLLTTIEFETQQCSATLTAFERVLAKCSEDMVSSFSESDGSAFLTSAKTMVGCIGNIFEGLDGLDQNAAKARQDEARCLGEKIMSLFSMAADSLAAPLPAAARNNLTRLLTTMMPITKKNQKAAAVQSSVTTMMPIIEKNQKAAAVQSSVLFIQDYAKGLLKWAYKTPHFYRNPERVGKPGSGSAAEYFLSLLEKPSSASALFSSSNCQASGCENPILDSPCYSAANRYGGSPVFHGECLTESLKEKYFFISTCRHYCFLLYLGLARLQEILRPS